MANILPVSDLRNYNEVLKNCHKGEPVYLTKNGRGRFVVMDIEDYERDRAEKKLLVKLQEAEEALTALAMSYELQPDDKASSCHPRTGTLSTASQVRKLRRVVEKQKT